MEKTFAARECGGFFFIYLSSDRAGNEACRRLGKAPFSLALDSPRKLEHFFIVRFVSFRFVGGHHFRSAANGSVF